MLSIQANIREISGGKLKELRKQGNLPAVLYGPKIKNQALVLGYKDFEKIYKEAGESTLIKLKIKNKKLKTEKEEEFQVLIHDIQTHPLTEKFVHVDFYQPEMKEKIEVTVPLAFAGSAPAEKNLGGIIVKNITEIEIKAFLQDLPKEILVDLSQLKLFEDNILVKDLKLSSGIEILREPGEVIASVSAPREEKELEKKEAPEEVAPVEESKSIKEEKKQTKKEDEEKSGQ